MLEAMFVFQVKQVLIWVWMVNSYFIFRDSIGLKDVRLLFSTLMILIFFEAWQNLQNHPKSLNFTEKKLETLFPKALSI